MKFEKSNNYKTRIRNLFLLGIILMIGTACTMIPPITDLQGGNETIHHGKKFIMKQNIWACRDEFIVKK